MRSTGDLEKLMTTHYDEPVRSDADDVDDDDDNARWREVCATSLHIKTKKLQL